MDASFLIPGGPDRRKQRQDAEDMAQIVKRNAERTNSAPPPYQFIELIGKGAFGRVYKCLEKSSGTLVAVKILNIDDMDFVNDPRDRDETVKDFRKEVTILQQLKESGARNVNLIHDAFDLYNQLWIISDYCTGGSVRTLMRANPASGGFEERYIIAIARELAVAMSYVHAIGVIHRDIKCTNVYITEEGEIQLGDFGIVGITDTAENSTSKRTTIIGTPWYMPKEMHVDSMSVAEGYGTEIDVWSFGITVYEMATGMVPNARIAPEELAYVLEEAPRLEGNDYSDSLRDFVAFCLNSDPKARPSAQEVLQHPYIADTERMYPTKSLVALIERYAAWEFKGGQRTSLFNPGGAAAPVSAVEAADTADTDNGDDWNFSASDDFLKDFSRRYSQMMLGPHFDAPAGSGLPPLKTNLTVLERIQLEHADKSATRGEASLDRVFNPQSAVYDSHTPVNMQQVQEEVLSDLPLRNTSTAAATRESTVMIDLDASPGMDAPTFNFDFEEMPTLKAKGRSLTQPTDDEDEESEYQYGQIEDGDDGRRATKDWTFPSASTTKLPKRALKDLPAKRATMEWSFSTAELAEPDETDALSTTPSIGSDESNTPGFRPRLQHTATVPLGQFGDYLHDAQTQVAIGMSQRRNNPFVSQTSPVRNSTVSMIDLDLGLEDPAEIDRPSTASSTTGSFMTSGNPFDLEDDPDLAEADRKRYSQHKQTQSDSNVGNGNKDNLPAAFWHTRAHSLAREAAGTRNYFTAPSEDIDPFDNESEYRELQHAPLNIFDEEDMSDLKTAKWPGTEMKGWGFDASPFADEVSEKLQLGPGLPAVQKAVDTTRKTRPASEYPNSRASRHFPKTLAFPDIYPPSLGAMDEDASPAALAAELERAFDHLGGVLGATGQALQQSIGLVLNEGNGVQSEESDTGFESTSSFGEGM